jgi:hypothetical protein
MTTSKSENAEVPHVIGRPIQLRNPSATMAAISETKISAIHRRGLRGTRGTGAGGNDMGEVTTEPLSSAQHSTANAILSKYLSRRGMSNCFADRA